MMLPTTDGAPAMFQRGRRPVPGDDRSRRERIGGIRPEARLRELRIAARPALAPARLIVR